MICKDWIIWAEISNMEGLLKNKHLENFKLKYVPIFQNLIKINSFCHEKKKKKVALKACQSNSNKLEGRIGEKK